MDKKHFFSIVFFIFLGAFSFFFIKKNKYLQFLLYKKEFLVYNSKDII